MFRVESGIYPLDAIMQLPRSAQDIADVIGRQKALYLIGQLPRVYTRDNRHPAAKNTKVVLYIPKLLNVTDNLVRLIGWNDASKLVREFGGMLIQPANCVGVYRPHRDANIARLHAEGLAVEVIAEWFDVSVRHVKNVVAENPPQAMPTAANDNAPINQKGAPQEWINLKSR